MEQACRPYRLEGRIPVSSLRGSLSLELSVKTRKQIRPRPEGTAAAY